MSKKKKNNPQETKDKIIESYLSFIKSKKTHPNKTALLGMKITDKMIRHHFGNITKLTEYIEKEHSDVIEKNIFNERSFTQERFRKVETAVKNTKRFFITTAVAFHPLHKGAYKAAKNFCKRKNAELLVIPVQDPATGNGSASDYDLPLELKSEHIVFGDIALNKNINVRAIKISAKQIKPLTGLARLGKRSGSFIFGSPKQFLESIPTSRKYPHLIMTTGAITKPNYQSSDAYFSQRTAYLANYDHVLGGLIVEVRNNEIYHVRHVQMEHDTGNFVDLGDYYTHDGKIKKMAASALSMGDLHPEQVDKTALNAWKKLCKKAGVKDLIIHDGFDGKSVSHHDYKKSITNARKFYTNTLSVEQELKNSIKIYKECEKMVSGTLNFAKSNHDEVLDRYLEEGRYVFDPINLRFASFLIAPMIDGKNVLKTALEQSGYDTKRMHFLERDEELRIAGIECGQHGDKGNNGARASVTGFEKAYGNCVLGHSHSPQIYRGVYINGTTSLMDLDYNIGPSSWCHASTLIYPNSSRQLIISIDGKMFL